MNYLHNVLDVLSLSDYSNNVAVRSTYSSSQVGNSILSGGCNSWSNFLTSNLVTNSLLYRTKSLTAIQSYLAFDGSLISNSTFHCESSKNVSIIVSHLIGNRMEDLSIFCNRVLWKVSHCKNSSVNIALCASCSDPCSGLVPISESALINPCNGNTIPRKHSIISVASVSFVELQQAPAITAITISSTQNSLSVKIVALGDGTTNCAAFPTLRQYTPSSQSVIILQNYAANLENNASTIVIGNLLAATNYDVYCMTTAVSGSFLPLPKIIALKSLTKTLCCKNIAIILNSMTSYELKNVLNMISIYVDSAPSQAISLSLTAVNLDTGTTLATFFPGTINLDNTYSSSQKLLASLIGPVAGKYNVTISVYGSSRNEFAVKYPNGRSFIVLAVGAEPPTPLLVSAMFLNDGSKIVIAFDSSTNKGGLNSFFDCSILMSFRGDSLSSCQWIDAATIYISPYVSYATPITIGDTIAFKSYSNLKASCTSTADSCATWKAVVGTSLIVRPPVTPISPVVAISTAAVIGSCDALLLDISGSTGSCGRPWTNLSITVSSSSGNTSLIQNFLDNRYQPNPPTPIPEAFLEKGATYYFLVSICNFLGSCGQRNTRVLVLTTIVPSVSILGPYLRTFTRSTPLSLSSNAYVMLCDGTRSSANIRYTWSVYVNGVQDFSITSKSKDPSKFLVPAYTLKTQVLYNIQLSASQSGNSKSSSASAQIYIAEANIVAVISGGLVRSMHPQDNLHIDGSSSYDEDIPNLTGSDAGLIFSWSCFQIAPVLQDECGVTVVGDNSSPTFILFADSNSVDSTSQIVLTIFDSSMQRSAQSRMSVIVVDDSTPQVAVTSDAAALLNPSRALLLTANAQIPPGSHGSGVWSVDDNSIQLGTISALPISVNLVKSSTISQLIFANSLPIGSTLTFTFSITLENGKTSASTVTVVTNAPPLPGLFQVLPEQGVELKTTFQFVALQWQDSSLPLSYQFGLVSSSGSLLSLQSRSESSFGATFLSAGLRSSNYSQILFLQVYDSLNSSTLAYANLIVTPMEPTNSSALKNNLLSQLSAGNSSVDGIKKSTSLVSSILNGVNCSAAPNCTELHRAECSTVQNTCGSCISAEYSGDTTGNTPCVSLTELEAVARGRKLTATSCSTSRDCVTSPYFNCVDGFCALPSKRCIEDCSGNGNCIYVRVDNGDIVESCFITEPSCSAICICNSNWQGRSCSISTEDMTNRNDMRHQVVASLTSLATLEDPTDESLSSWSHSLAVATQSFDELHSSTLFLVHDLVSSIVSNALSVGSTYDKTEGVLGSLDSVFNNIATSSQVSSARRFLQGANSSVSGTDNSKIISSSQSTLQQYSQLVVNGMIVGQQPVSSIGNQFRILAVVASAEASNVSLAAPLSPLEMLSGSVASEMKLLIGNLTSSIKASTVLFNSNLFGNAGFNSNPFQLNINSDLAQCARSTECFVELVLQNNRPTNISVNSPSAVKVIKCTASNLGAVKVACPNDQYVTVSCNSTEQTVTVQCPTVYQHSVCNSVLGSSSASSGCKTVNFTALTTTCLCPLTSHQVAGLWLHGRRLKKVNVVQSANSTYIPLQRSISYVAMLQSISSSFLSTAESAQNLNGATIEKSWQVLVTIGVIGLAIVVSALGGHYADQRDKMAKIYPDKASNISKNILSQLFSIRHEQGLKKFNKSMQQLEQKTPEVKIIEASLPNVLRSNSMLQKIVVEERQFHKWFGIAFHFSPIFPRVLRIMSLATSVISMLFVQAITYNINNPDDGTCELQQTRAACLAQTSSIQEGAQKCYYTYDNGAGSCHFNQPASNIQVVMFVAIFAATISTPIAISADWVICQILIAKTRSSSIAPLEDAATAAEVGPSGQKVLTLLENTLEDELNEMTAFQQQFKETLPSEQAKEFSGNYFFLHR